MTPFVLVRLDAGNDTNGNPRRVWVALGLDGIAGVNEEAYRGRGAGYELADKLGADDVLASRLMREAVTFNTTPAEFRALLSGAKR